jgi:hypothetical protein
MFLEGQLDDWLLPDDVRQFCADGRFTWQRLCDPARFLFREFWGGAYLFSSKHSGTCNRPLPIFYFNFVFQFFIFYFFIHLYDHCPVYYEIEYMELFLQYPTPEETF